MNQKTNFFMVSLPTKRVIAAMRGCVLAGLLGCVVFNTRAAVQVTRFDPPLQISAYAEPATNAYFDVLGTDFDANGEVDFRLGYGQGWMSAYFNAPVRFGQRVAQPEVIGRGGPVAGVPLNSIIGTNIVSSDATNFYVWSSGDTNFSDLTQPLGDHEATVIIANIVTFNTPQSEVVTFSSNGVLVTNIIFPQPIVSGDVVGKDAVMAVEFYEAGQRHYGYIHFDFRGGAGGVIYGWAYETAAEVPIQAKSLAPGNIGQPGSPAARSGIIGLVHEGNLPGWTITVFSDRGSVVTNVTTADGGLFKVDLAPGLYELVPVHGPPVVPALAVPNSSMIGRSRRVTVLRNHFRFVELTP